MAQKWDILKLPKLTQMQGLDELTVAQLIQSGKLGPEDCVRKSGEEKWYRIAKAQDYFLKRLAQAEAAGEAIAAPAAADAPAVAVTASQAPTAPPPSPKARKHAPNKAIPSPNRMRQHDTEMAEEADMGRRSLDIDEYDLTPMVDMTFLLNMFFMLTTSYALLHSLQVPPPNPEKNSKAKSVAVQDLKETFIVVRIEADNSIKVDEEEIAERDLLGTIQDRAREGKTELLVDADGDSYYEMTVKVIDAAKEVGLNKIALGTRTEG